MHGDARSASPASPRTAAPAGSPGATEGGVRSHFAPRHDTVPLITMESFGAVLPGAASFVTSNKVAGVDSRNGTTPGSAPSTPSDTMRGDAGSPTFAHSW